MLQSQLILSKRYWKSSTKQTNKQTNFIFQSLLIGGPIVTNIVLKPKYSF